MVDSLIKHKLLAAQLNSFLIEYEARKMGLTTHRIDHLLLTYSDENNNQVLFRRAASPGVTSSADTICMNKVLLKRLWFHHSLPVNPWLAMNGDEVDNAVGFCKKHSWNVVVKPTLCVDIGNENTLDSTNIVFNEKETDAGICGHHLPSIIWQTQKCYQTHEEKKTL